MDVPGGTARDSGEYGQAVTLLPVLDLRAGIVVQARAGLRGQYAAMQSPLVAGCAPVDLARALLQRTGSKALYVADLDAILGGPAQLAVLAALGRALPGLQLWLDAGFQSLAAAQSMQAQLAALGVSSVLPVLGTETLARCEDLSWSPALVLSLDFAAEGFRGDATWLERPERWPARVIVMTLTAVGMDQGPDFDRLGQCQALANGRTLYAAGGVRHQSDLQALQRLGVRGALVASAVHRGDLP